MERFSFEQSGAGGERYQAASGHLRFLQLMDSAAIVGSVSVPAK
jgi:hypothetical protein